MKEALFAGGCFWCTEADLRKIDGVADVVSGYIGRSTDTTPTYENHKGFREGVKVIYDEEKISFKKLCQFFLDHIDPTDEGGQFYDRGEAYRTALYFSDEGEKSIATSLIEELAQSGIYEKPIVVEVLPKETFYDGEEYHQNYADKNPVRYELYKQGSGRVRFVNEVCQIREEKRIQWKD